MVMAILRHNVVDYQRRMMRKITIVMFILALLVTSFVIAQTITLSKEKEQKVKDFIKVDFKDAKDITVDDLKVISGIIIFDIKLDNKRITVITTNEQMDRKILSKNSLAKLVEIKEDMKD